MNSDGCMETHHKLEAVLHTDQQVFPVVNINIEFPLEGIVDEDASLHANLVVF